MPPLVAPLPSPAPPADAPKYQLITGHHRLAACRQLEEQLDNKTIAATIRDYKEGDAPYYRLEEITENVFRNELNALDRAHALYELDQIYKSLYPELKHGGDRKSEEAKNQSAINALRSELLEKVGLSKRRFISPPRSGVAFPNNQRPGFTALGWPNIRPA